MGGVIISHPGRQHSHQLALALHNAEILEEYWTGIPTRPLMNGLVPKSIVDRFFRYDFLPLPADKVVHNLVPPLLRKAMARWAPGHIMSDLAHRIDSLFDLWAAARLRRLPSGAAVVAYENGALFTFREAKRQGLITILDAASFHHETQDSFLPPAESPKAHQRIVRRKNAELDLADYVFCVSQLAADSYRRAGVEEHRLKVVPLGADVERFKVVARPNAPSGPFRFAFAGTVSARKGVNVLFDAFRRVRASRPRVELHVYGTNSLDGTSEVPAGTVTTRRGVTRAACGENLRRGLFRSAVATRFIWSCGDRSDGRRSSGDHFGERRRPRNDCGRRTRLGRARR